MIKKLIFSFCLLMISFHASVSADQNSCCPSNNCCETKKNSDGICGKVDLSAIWVHIDMLESGKTVHSMNLGGLRGDFCYCVWQGLQIRPTILYAKGRKEDYCLNGGVGIGFAIPINDCYWLTPVGGITWGNLKTRYTYMIPVGKINDVTQYSKTNILEKFRTASPYVGLEGTWKISEGLRILASYQYVWSRTHSKIRNLKLRKSNDSKGSNFTGMIEYDLNSSWSVNVGGAYNVSLEKEKLGIRVYGAKLGLAYWF